MSEWIEIDELTARSIKAVGGDVWYSWNDAQPHLVVGLFVIYTALHPNTKNYTFYIKAYHE